MTIDEALQKLLVFETYEVDHEGNKFISDGTVATATRKLPYQYSA